MTKAPRNHQEEIDEMVSSHAAPSQNSANIRSAPREPKYVPPSHASNGNIMVHGTGSQSPIWQTSCDRLLAIVNVAIEQREIIWDMDDYNAACQLQRFLRRQK